MNPNRRSVASLSAWLLLAGVAPLMLNAVPSSSTLPVSRIARAAIPCARLTMCVARIAIDGSRMPGAWWPFMYPMIVKTQGSLKIIHFFTRSPSFSTMLYAYSSKRLAVSRLAQPPFSCSACGKSQW